MNKFVVIHRNDVPRRIDISDPFEDFYVATMSPTGMTFHGCDVEVSTTESQKAQDGYGNIPKNVESPQSYCGGKASTL